MENFTYDPKESWADIQEEEERDLKQGKKNLNNSNVQPKTSTNGKYQVPKSNK